MVEIEHWTRSMVQAWEYALAGLRSGLEQTEAYEMYKTGGGKIRTSYWSDVWHTAETIEPNADYILSMPKAWTIPEEKFTDPHWITQQAYMIQTQIGFFDPKQKKWRTEWRSLEFDARPTGKFLDYAISETLRHIGGGKIISEWELLDVIAYHTSGKVEEEEE